MIRFEPSDRSPLKAFKADLKHSDKVSKSRLIDQEQKIRTSINNVKFQPITETSEVLDDTRVKDFDVLLNVRTPGKRV